MAFEKGTTDFKCPNCGAVNRVSWTDYPEKDTGVINCAVPSCGAVIDRWKSTRDYHAVEVVTPGD